jgi:hypothetical protein
MLYSVLTLREVYIYVFILFALIGVVRWVKFNKFLDLLIAVIGFIVASFFLGILIDIYSVTILVWALLFTQLIILFLSFSIPDKKFELIGDTKRSI